MPTPWNDATDRQLLLAVIHLTGSQTPKWDQVANLMGDSFTAESTRQHFRKLKVECEKSFGGFSSTPAGTPSKDSPSKQTVAKTAKSSSKRKASHEDGHDADEEGESPSKKPNVKKEEDEDE